MLNEYYTKGVIPTGSYWACILRGDSEGAIRMLVEPQNDPNYPMIRTRGMKISSAKEVCEWANDQALENLPEFCWGTPEKVRVWVGHKGLSFAPDEIKIFAKLSERA